jgi:hypothetical protein
MGLALRWLVFAPTAVFMAFVMLVEVNNVSDWLSSDWSAVAAHYPVAYILADLAWPMVFVLVAAFVAPAGRLVIAWIFACLAVATALVAGGSLSLYWIAPVFLIYHKIGLGATVAGAFLGVWLVRLILARQPTYRPTAAA